MTEILIGAACVLWLVFFAMFGVLMWRIDRLLNEPIKDVIARESRVGVVEQ